MSLSGTFRIVGIGVVIASGMVVALAGQGSTGRAAATPGRVAESGRVAASGEDQLLAEVRALRAELNEAAQATMRAQLLGMRLQLEEQRINTLGRQLSDTQDKRRANDRAKEPMTAGLRMLRGHESQEGAEKGELDHITGPLRAQVDALDRDDQQLKAQEAELVRLLAEEQARWSSFNTEIEALERAARGKMR